MIFKILNLLTIPALIVISAGNGFAQKSNPSKDNFEKLKQKAAQEIQAGYKQYHDLAMQIWDFAELGYKEEKSSAALMEVLQQNGFKIESGVAGIPTAFVASYGAGSPVIGILAEYDALPGLSQDRTAEKQPLAGKTAGHACGHHLFGAGSVAAAVAVKKLIASGELKGTIKIFGCPAEEGGSGKVYMVREGLFTDVDAVLHWHPSDKNTTTVTSALANKSAKFRFYGTASHAAAAPEKGRSALDAVEAMNFMTNMMREHIPAEARIHYVITAGGKAPNVVPEFSEVYYYVRHPQKDQVVDIFDRVVKAAEGAATGTETKFDFELIGGTHDLLINETLAELMHTNLLDVGGVQYSPDEERFAGEIQKTFSGQVPPINSAYTITPVTKRKSPGSTDVGDVSYAVPTVGLEAATWVPGTAAHSWQAVAAGGTAIGSKGMLVAAKAMSFTIIDLLKNPAFIRQAKEEYKRSLGDYQYKALLGDRKPALNYRD